MKRLSMTMVMILVLLLAACGEPDPADQLASQLRSTSENILHEMHLRDVEVEPAAQDGSFDAVVPVAFLVAVDPETDEIMQQTMDDMRLFMYGLVLSLVNEFQQAGLDGQLDLLTFHIIHPDTDEVQIEVDLPADVRAALDFDVDDETGMALVRSLPEVASRYEDNFEQEDFDEVIQFFEAFMGRS